MDSTETPLADIHTYLKHANHKLANDEFGACAPVDFATTTYGHLLIEKIHSTDVTEDPQLAQQLCDHPLASIRRAFLQSVYQHRSADEALCTQVEMRLVNAGETDTWIRSLIATHTRSFDCAKALRGCPEATVRQALAARSVALEDAKIPVQANSQEELLAAARDTPVWGKTRIHGEYDEPLFRTEATAGRLGAWLDRSTANPESISAAELAAGREALTALVAALRAAKRPRSGVQTVDEKMCWPVHALASSLYDHPGKIDEGLLLTKLCYEFGLLWTETGNIGIETTDRTVLRTALEPDLGVGTHTRRKMLPQLWGETHVDRDGVELSAEEVREQLVKIGVEKFGPLLRLIRKAGIAETRERTGLDTIRVTRGMTLEADIAQRVGVGAGKEKIVVATLPDTGLGQASLASTSPKARPLYGTSPRDGHVNIVLIADVPLDKFMGLSGIGYSDGHYIEHDCPVGVLDPTTVTVVATDVHDDAGREKFEQLLDHLFTAPDPHLAARQHVKQGEQPRREPIRVNVRRPARTFSAPAPAIS